MHRLLAVVALLAAPFWESKSPGEWSAEELQQILHESPWARVDGTQIYLASALPMLEAEEQVRLRRRVSRPGQEQELDSDYAEFLRQNRGKHIVVAVRLPDPNALADAAESRRMEEQSVLKVGRRKHKMVGHFPPTSTDPYLRLIYPRAVEPSTKSFTVELYLPSLPGPYRMVQFDLKEMTYRGKLEM